MFPIDLPVADNFDTLGFVAARGKFLVSRFRDWDDGRKDSPRVGPEKPELHLVDPATGTVEPVAGEFWFPVYDRCFRPLQASSTDSQVWAAEGRNDVLAGISTERWRRYRRSPRKLVVTSRLNAAPR